MSALPLATFSAPGVPLWQPYGSSGTTSTVQYADKYDWQGVTYPTNSVEFDMTAPSATSVVIGTSNATAEIVLEGSSGTLSIDAPGTIKLNTNPAGAVQTAELLASTLSTSLVTIDGQTLTATSTELLLNGIPLATLSNLSSIADWSLDPAISTVQMNGNDIIGIKNLFANTLSTNTLYTNTLFATSTVEQFVSTVNIVGQQAFFSSLNGVSVPGLLSTTSGNTNAISSLNGTVSTLTSTDWALWPAVSTVQLNENPIASSNITLNAKDNVNINGNDVFLTADEGSNPNIPQVNITAKGGIGGNITLTADTGVGGTSFGAINLVANGGTTGGIGTGGSITIQANTPVGTVSNASSKVTIDAAGVNVYAGAVAPIGSLTGYLFQYGTLGINQCVGLPSVVPNFPGTLYQYATGGIGYGGIRMESPSGVECVNNTDFYAYRIYPYFNPFFVGTLSNLLISGRTHAVQNTQYLDLELVKNLKFGDNSNEGNITGVSSINGIAWPLPPPQTLTAGNQINITANAINLNSDVYASTLNAVSGAVQSLSVSSLSVSSLNGVLPVTAIPSNLTVSTLTSGGATSGFNASFENILTPGEGIQIRSIDDNITSILYTSTGTDVIQMDMGLTTPIIGATRNQFRFQGPVEILPGLNGAYEITDTKFQILNAGLQAPQLLGVSSINGSNLSAFGGIQTLVGGSNISITNASTINLNPNVFVSSLSAVTSGSILTSMNSVVFSNVYLNRYTTTPWFSPTPSVFYIQIPDTGYSNQAWFFVGTDMSTTYYNNLAPQWRFTGVYYTSNLQKVIVPDWADFLTNSNFPVGAYVETFVTPLDTGIQGVYYIDKIINQSNRGYFYAFDKSSSNTIEIMPLTLFNYSTMVYTGSYIGEQSILVPSYVSTPQLFVSSINGQQPNFGGAISTFTTLQTQAFSVSSINGQPISFYEPGGVSTVSTFVDLYTSTLAVSTLVGSPNIDVRGNEWKGTVSSFSVLAEDTQNILGVSSNATFMNHSNYIFLNSGGVLDITTANTLEMSGTTVNIFGSKIDMNTSPLFVSSIQVSSINGQSYPPSGSQTVSTFQQLYTSSLNVSTINGQPLQTVSTFNQLFTSTIQLNPNTILASPEFAQLNIINQNNFSTGQVFASVYVTSGRVGDTNFGAYTRDINNRATYLDSNLQVNRLAYTIDSNMSLNTLSTQNVRFQTGNISSILFASTFQQSLPRNTLFLDNASDFNVGSNNIWASQLKLGFNQPSGAPSFNRRAEVTFFNPANTGYDLSVQNGDYAIRYATTQSTLTVQNEGYLLDTRVNIPFLSSVNNSINLMAAFFPSTLTGTIGASTLSVYQNYIWSGYSSTTQIVAGTNTITPLTFNSQVANIGGFTQTASTITVPASGVYSIDCSIQFITGSSGKNDAIWFLQKNGVPVPQTSSRVSVNNNADAVGTTVYTDFANAGDQYSFCIYSADNQMSAGAVVAGAVPAIPSIIANVRRLG